MRFPYPSGQGSQGPTSSKGGMSYIVKGQAESDGWHLTAEIHNNTGHEARFDGGVDALLHLLCNGHAGDVPLQNPSVTSMPAGGGVILEGVVSPIDSGPGTCTVYGTLHYTTV